MQFVISIRTHAYYWVFFSFSCRPNNIYYHYFQHIFNLCLYLKREIVNLIKLSFAQLLVYEQNKKKIIELQIKF